jgi:hypothetical protein
MIKLTLLSVVLFLSGCASSVLASSERSVVVHSAGFAKAQAVADTECAKHGRKARFAHRPQEFQYAYDCVL